ncbi:MAG: class I SAM-dependent methyltransferase [Alphaproteobacteria bacterium]|nr:class I SAM-dependent methyltransferase [Alphaproteobacteria bacterium]MCB9794269.1 class I SAM-dependent methyltransferase [Alphaproteobacteria bacterium]
MNRLVSWIYDPIMAATEAGGLRAWRAELLSQARGAVLEIGAGTGANLPLYGDQVERLVLCEPSPGMHAQLAARLGDREAELLAAPAEALPLPDASVDTVVSTLVLCSVADLEASLAEIKRVLRPGGRLLFIEHVAAQDRPGRLAWQRRLEPAWRCVAGNCHLTRRTGEAIAAAGLVPETLIRESLRKTPPFVRPSVRGVAVKP